LYDAWPMSLDRRTIAAAFVAVAVAQVGVVAAFLSSRSSGTDSALVGLPLDDGWIHLVYARNLAERGELAYNPGEAEAGVTSPLWVALLAPTARLDARGPVVAAKVTSALFAVLCCLLAAWLARELAGDVAGLAAALAIAIDPSFAFSAASGMEVCLTASLMLASLLAMRRRAAILAGLLLGLAWLSRPESAALLLVIVPWVVALIRKSELSSRRALLGAAIMVAVAAPFVIYCLSVTGRPLPNTFYVKSALATNPADGLWVLVRGVLAPSTFVGFGGGIVLYALGLRSLVRDRDPDRLAVATAPWAFLAAVIMSRPMPAAEAETYYYIRYLHPALPLLLVVLGCGAAALLRREKAPKRRKRKKPAEQKRASRRWVVALCSAGVAASTIYWLPKAIERYSWNTQNIEEMQVAVGRWIARETPPDAVIAASDAGAVRYFGGRRVIDVMALNYHRGVEAR